MKEISITPVTDFIGAIKIKGMSIPCAVLYPETNPTSVIVQREIVGLLTGNKKGGFERYLKPKNLQPYLPAQFRDKPLSESVINFFKLSIFVNIEKIAVALGLKNP